MNELKIEARGLFRWIKGARLVFLVLTLVGIARVIGSSLGIPTMVAFGNFFAASPAPIPFQNPRSNEESAASILCQGPGEERKEFKWSTELERQIPGPHRHHVFFLNLKNQIIHREERAYSHALRKAFCGEAYVAKALGCPLPVRRLEISHRGNTPSPTVVECAK